MSSFEVGTLMRVALTLYEYFGHVRVLRFFWSGLAAWGR